MKHFKIYCCFIIGAFVLPLLMVSCVSTLIRAKPVPKYFALCSVNLDGSEFTEIIKDKNRQMSHARVSKDHKMITFTRFNKMNRQGIAIEGHSYNETEIVVCGIDGSKPESVVPPKKEFTNANSYWMPNGKKFLYISNDNPHLKKKKPQIYRYNLKNKKRTLVPVSSDLFPFDPHQVGDLLVMPAGTKKIPKNRIWIMDKNGKNARQLSPAGKKEGSEFDPKISPDMTKVAFMRFKKKMNLQKGVDIIVVDIKTGKAKNLSPPDNRNVDAMPEWSSDGKLLLFWHVNFKNHQKAGLYTIRPDGSRRKKINLPKGYFYTMPSFFPNTGSGKKAKIIFAARQFN